MHRRRTRSDALPQLERRAVGGGEKRQRKARGWLDDDDTYNGEQLKRRAVADETEDLSGSETQLPGRPDTEQGSDDSYERNGQSTEEDSDTVRAREQRDDEECDSGTREQRHDQHDDSDDQDDGSDDQHNAHVARSSALAAHACFSALYQSSSSVSVLPLVCSSPSGSSLCARAPMDTHITGFQHDLVYMQRYSSSLR